MDTADAFGVLNALVLPWWGVWLAVPRSRLAARLAGHTAVFLALGGVYLALMLSAVADGSLGIGAVSLDFDSLRAGLAGPRAFLAGWTHYLAFDLFCGAWIVREARRLDVAPRIELFFTLVTGPIGLALFLARRAWRLRTLGQLGEVDLA
jgi:hypothetical protein